MRIRFAALSEGLPAIDCLSCHAPMDLHQPDAKSPDRLLATCGECGDWYLLEPVPGSDEAVMVPLHDGGYILTATGVNSR